MAHNARTARAIENFGEDICLHAFKMSEIDGEGPSNIGCCLSLTTAQANAAIDAGREIASDFAVTVSNNGGGGFECSTMINDALFTRRYIGYDKDEAVRAFVRSATIERVR